MTKILKNSVAVMLMLLLVCTVAFIASPEVAAADPGTTVSNPIILTPDVFYTRYWTKDNDHLNCYCKIEVPSRGYVTFTVIKPLDSEGEAGTFVLDLYDPTGELLWGANTYALKDSFSDSYVYKIGLDAGTYYMNLDPSFTVTSGSIPATFKYSFTASDTWEIEPNGDQSQALPIELETMYSGVYCEESFSTSYDDYFEIELTANKTYLFKIDNQSKIENAYGYTKIFDPFGKSSTFMATNKYKQEGSTYIWKYIPRETGTYYIVLNNSGNKAPVEYKIGMFEYICQHTPLKVATCYTKAVCLECGEEYGDFDKSNHSNLLTISAVAPRCTSTGLTEGKKCLRCGEIAVAQNVIPEKGHSLTTLPAVAATCTKEGKTEGKRCTTCYTVTVAQQTVPAKGHKLTTLPAVSATCTESGLTEGKKCSTCGTVTVAQRTVYEKGHTLTTLKAVAATCTKAGKTEGKKCSTCAEVTVAQKTVAAKGHTLTTLKAVAATCTKSGLTEGKKCSTCGTVTVAQKTVAAKGHTLTTLKAVAATCTKAGKTEGKKCSTCGTVTVAQKTVAKKAHTYKTTTTKATLTKNGKAVTKCTACGNVSKTTTFYYPKTIKLAKTAYTYNGKAQKPAVTVKDSKGNALKKDKDYTVKYESGCKATGKYTVTVTFKGNYTGTKKLTFTIAPKATSKITAAQSTKAIKLTWKKVTGADGYRVFQYNTKTKKWAALKTLTGTSYKVEKLKAGTAYKFRVQAYTKDDGTIWGATKDFSTATKPATSKITKLTTTKAKAAVVWSNVDGENGYEVYASTKKDSGFKKVATTKVNVAKATISKLASGKTYYFKVRAYKTVGESKVYSAWSSVKSVKAK